MLEADIYIPAAVAVLVAVLTAIATHSSDVRKIKALQQSEACAEIRRKVNDVHRCINDLTVIIAACIESVSQGRGSVAMPEIIRREQSSSFLVIMDAIYEARSHGMDYIEESLVRVGEAQRLMQMIFTKLHENAENLDALKSLPATQIMFIPQRQWWHHVFNRTQTFEASLIMSMYDRVYSHLMDQLVELEAAHRGLISDPAWSRWLKVSDTRVAVAQRMDKTGTEKIGFANIERMARLRGISELRRRTT